MKKKVSIISVILMLALCMTAGLTAFAAESQEVPGTTDPGTTKPGVEKPDIEIGNINTTKSKLPENFGNLTMEPVATTSAEYAAAKNKVAELTTNNANTEFLGVFDISLFDKGGAALTFDKGEVVIRMEAPGLRYYDSVVALHQEADGTWKPVVTTAYDGYFTFVPESFSLYAFAATPGAAPSTTSTTKTSAKTGVND